jgi:putative lipoic acid-binding regulatory protein
MANENQEKAKVEYPCPWGFKVIGNEEGVVRQAVIICLQDVCAGREYTLEMSNISENGKYVSLNLSLTVESEDDRNGIFTSLADSSEIMMVI